MPIVGWPRVSVYTHKCFPSCFVIRARASHADVLFDAHTPLKSEIASSVFIAEHMAIFDES
jgi:hypothetical protein